MSLTRINIPTYNIKTNADLVPSFRDRSHNICIHGHRMVVGVTLFGTSAAKKPGKPQSKVKYRHCIQCRCGFSFVQFSVSCPDECILWSCALSVTIAMDYLTVERPRRPSSLFPDATTPHKHRNSKVREVLFIKTCYRTPFPD